MQTIEILCSVFIPTWWQVVHGCRQLVSWDVRLSPVTSATLVFSCQRVMAGTLERLSLMGKEGGDDVKSACPLWLGLHTYYNGRYNEEQYREVEQNSKSRSKFGLESATRLHEVGIASNRGSACRGEYVPGPCTHRPSHHPSWMHPKWLTQPACRREVPKECSVRGVKS